MKEFIIGFICALFHRCKKCGSGLCVIRYSVGLIDGYGLYYCPKCTGIIEML